MNMAQEEQAFHIFMDGLREYIKRKSHGKFLGKMLAPDWQELSEAQQDVLISEAFVIHAEMLTEVAYNEIHRVN